MKIKKPLSWCVLTLNTTGFSQSAELYEIGAVGVDNKKFKTQTRPHGYISGGVDKETLPETPLDKKGLTTFLARYDVIISHNAFFTAPLIQQYLPTKAVRKEAGSVLPFNVFACSLSMYDWKDVCCKKLGCLSGEGDHLGTIERCCALIKTLKLKGVTELVATAEKDYTMVGPAASRMSTDDFARAIDNGFTKHGGGWIKYVESPLVANMKKPFKVVGGPVPRHRMFINKMREEER